MKYLRDLQERIKLSTCRRNLPTLVRVVKELGLKNAEIVYTDFPNTIRIPCDILDSPCKSLLTSLMISSYTVSSHRDRVFIGLDPGETNIGIAVLVNEYIVYRDVFRNLDLLLMCFSELRKFSPFKSYKVFIGSSPGVKGIVDILVEKLIEYSFDILIIDEENLPHAMVTYPVIIEDNRHIIDALRVVLAGISEEERLK